MSQPIPALARDTVRMTTLPGGQGDTVRDTEAPEDVKVLFAKIGAGKRVDRTVLVEQLERMLGLVRATNTAFDDVVLLVRRRTPLEIAPGHRAPDAYAVHTLPDGSALVHTTWTMQDKDDFFRVLDLNHRDWIEDHDDVRGIAVLRGSQLEVARAATSYEDALYVLGADVTFMPSRR